MLTAAHEFGQLLDTIMREHDLNQDQLGTALGYSGQAWISHVRTGRKAPSFDMASRIADTFPEHNEIDVYRLIKDARSGYADGQMRGYLTLAAA